MKFSELKVFGIGRSCRNSFTMMICFFLNGKLLLCWFDNLWCNVFISLRIFALDIFISFEMITFIFFIFL